MLKAKGFNAFGRLLHHLILLAPAITAAITAAVTTAPTSTNDD
jgi:hypothetical protein